MTTTTAVCTTTFLSLLDLRSLAAGLYILQRFTNHGCCVSFSSVAVFKTCCSLLSWFLCSRCAALALLKLHPKSLVILAPVCSSFSYMCTGQSGRSYFCPLGFEEVRWVREGNIMCSRVVLLIWLCCALELIFLLEQPGEAKFGNMPRWQFFCRNIAYVSW